MLEVWQLNVWMATNSRFIVMSTYESSRYADWFIALRNNPCVSASPLSTENLYYFIDFRGAVRIPIRKYSRTLSEKEARILTDLSYRNRTIFTLEDARRLVGDPKNVLDWLVRKKWILKIRKGVYAIAPLEAGEKGADRYTVHSFVIGSLLTKPYYIGYWSALNHYGFTEQTPPCVYVATPKPRNSRKILDVEFKFVTIASRKMFGITTATIENRPVNISTPAKTFVDCLDHPEHAGGIDEVAKALYFSAAELKLKTLAKTAIKIGNGAAVKRLGYVSEILGLDECLSVLENAEIKKGYSLLDPLSPKKGQIKERWSLVVNTTIDPKRREQ